MASRLGLGNRTNASARLEALLRVIVRLSFMIANSRPRRGLIFAADRRQPSRFGQGWIAFAIPMAAMAVFMPEKPALFQALQHAPQPSPAGFAEGVMRAPRRLAKKYRPDEHKKRY